MNVIKLSALASIVSAFTLLGCGGGDGEQTASVSFYVSDAPVDKASSVSISFSMVELVDDEGNSFFS